MTDQTPAGVALKPCPFCGDDTIHTRIIETTDPEAPYVYHECDRCQVETMARDRDEAVEAWNTRTPASGAVEAAIKALDTIRETASHIGDAFANQTALNGIADAAEEAIAALTSEPKAEEEAKTPGQRAFEAMRDSDTYSRVRPSWDDLPEQERQAFEEDASARPRLYGLSAPQPLQGGEVTREAVARIIDPVATQTDSDGCICDPNRTDTALAKAAAILALLSAGRGEEGEDQARIDYLRKASAGHAAMAHAEFERRVKVSDVLIDMIEHFERVDASPEEKALIERASKIYADLAASSLPAGGEDEAWLDELRVQFADFIGALIAGVGSGFTVSERQAYAKVQAGKLIDMISAARKGGA